MDMGLVELRLRVGDKVSTWAPSKERNGYWTLAGVLGYKEASQLITAHDGSDDIHEKLLLFDGVHGYAVWKAMVACKGAGDE